MATDSVMASHQDVILTPANHEAIRAVGHWMAEYLTSENSPTLSPAELAKKVAQCSRLDEILPKTTITENNPDKPNFDDPGKHLEDACKEAMTTRTLTNETRQEFEDSVALADGLDHKTIQARWNAATKKLDQEIPTETSKQVQQADLKMQDAMKKLTPAAREEFEKLQDRCGDAQSDAEKENLRAQMEKLSPDAMAAQKRLHDLLGPYQDDIDQANQYRALSNAQLETRLNYARALTQFGDQSDKKRADCLLHEIDDIVRHDGTPKAEQDAKLKTLSVMSALPFPVAK